LAEAAANDAGELPWRMAVAGVAAWRGRWRGRPACQPA
jgi:hypothetical protein